MKRHTPIPILLFVIISLSTQMIQAQFSRYYLDITHPRGIQTSDGGFAFMGCYNQDVLLHRLDQMGEPIWEKPLWPNGISRLYAGKILKQTSDGGYAVGWTWNSERYFKRLDQWGDTLWTTDFSSVEENFSLVEAIETHDHGFVASGYVLDTAQLKYLLCLAKIDSLGHLSWLQRYDLDSVNQYGGRGLIELEDHGYAFIGYSSNNTGQELGTHLLRTDSAGMLQWNRFYGDSTSRYTPERLYRLQNGNWIITGQYTPFDYSDPSEGWALWVDSSGTTLQQRRYDFEDVYRVIHVLEDSNGVLTMTGMCPNPGGSYSATRLWETDAQGQMVWNKWYYWPGIPDFVSRTPQGGYSLIGQQMVVRWASFSIADSAGNVNTNVLEGQFFLDDNSNCILDSGETAYTPLPLGLTARNILTNQSFYSKADSGDFFRINLPLGTYELIPSGHPYLSYPCTDPDTVTFFSPYQSIRYDVAVQIQDSCPYNQVSIGSPFLRIGDTCRIDVRAWNDGTVASTYTTVEVELDSFLTYLSSDVPLLSQSGQTLFFELDTLEVGASKTIQIQAYLDSTVVPGQAHCLEAHVFPDSVCGTGNLWQGASIQAGVKCLGDSIAFSLKNLGTTMLAHRNYLIYIDDVIFRMDSFQLNSGDSLEIVDPATAGATYRIEAEQEAGFPITLGDPLAIAFKEGCLPLANGGFNTGWVNSFYNGNAAPAQAINCLENGTSYDPNDKRAQPFGYDSLHYIRANTPINYQIRFQNTGTDTAQRVIILDTLSQFLDPSSIVPGTSSHPYTWSISQQNVLRFKFQPIELVDSLTNPEGSQGYVQFTIRQQVDNPIGTLIKNSAAIYFDFNPPVITNTAYHEIGEDFLRIELIDIISTAEPLDKLRVAIAPNPVGNRARVVVEGGNFQLYTLELFNINGQKVYARSSRGEETLWIEPQGLPRGIYTYQLDGDGQYLQRGRIRLK